MDNIYSVFEWMCQYQALCQANMMAIQLLSCSSSTGFEQMSNEEKSNAMSIEFLTSQKRPKINLSKQDLQKVSYQNNKKPWEEEQDNLLRHYVEVEKLPWSQVPNMIPGRNEKMCYSRYRRLSLQAKQYWKKADNQKILELIKLHGQNWRQISQHFEGRSAKQIRQHYLNFLRADIKKQEFTIEQDMKIVQLINKYGKKWKYFQSVFEGRTQNQIKNRYYGRLKKMIMKKQKKRKYNN